MQTTQQSRAVDLHESVRSLLVRRNTVLWPFRPRPPHMRPSSACRKNNIGALVVLNARHLAGTIAKRDYARKIILKGRQPCETLVREIMSAPVLVVTPDRTIAECMQLITSRRIRHLPVVEGDRVIGMVLIGYLVNWIITAQEQTIRHLHNYIAGSYPG